MFGSADPFIDYVLAQSGKLSDDTRRDLEDGWSFNPARIPGTVALLYRMHQLGADKYVLDMYWSTLGEYIRERPYDAVEAMQVLADGAGHFLSHDQTPMTLLISDLEESDDWVSPEDS
ncbi:hypothetical protein [Streptomyces cinerochromogenes]|uniref:hypothetical protein n=1 Tax=Streptomyces cinerochromogenes TaxID=66422 RepID=UPI0016707748|nr:hypothetical protein [Streptomyces cinerochromogenes]GGT05392.1 hypothetical protein GCM10010206_79380 [Streptomyces cinerochromogenes]